VTGFLFSFIYIVIKKRRDDNPGALARSLAR
jgi:hypothetical protein